MCHDRWALHAVIKRTIFYIYTTLYQAWLFNGLLDVLSWHLLFLLLLLLLFFLFFKLHTCTHNKGKPQEWDVTVSAPQWSIHT